MTDLEANAPIPVAALADPLPPRSYSPAAPVARTSWGALALAFFLGGFTSFLATSLLALVVVFCIVSMGEKSNNTFEFVSGKVKPSGSSTFKPVTLDPPANDTFKHVGDAVRPGDDVFKRVDPGINRNENDPPDPKDDQPFKDK